MKFRWKLFLLLLGISIIPIVSLRTFGIYNVHLMADALVAQEKQIQKKKAENDLRQLVSRYSEAFAKIRQQAEMALFFQTFALKRILRGQTDTLQQQTRSEKKSALTTKSANSDSHSRLASAGPVKQTHPGTEFSKLCFAKNPATKSGDAPGKIAQLQTLTPIYRATAEHLGELVVRQYIGLQNGTYGIYPCSEIALSGNNLEQQVWYEAVFKENISAWSRPYTDPVTRRNVIAVSLPITLPDETIIGVSSLVLSIDSLVNLAMSIPELPPRTTVALCTLAIKPPSGQVGAKILGFARQRESSDTGQSAAESTRWLLSPDQTQFQAMLQDFAARRFQIRRMPFDGKMSLVAYTHLPHQGTAAVFIVPQDEILEQSQHLLKFIQHRVNSVELFTAGFLLFLSLVAAIVALIFSRAVTRPLETLSNAAQQLAGGDFDTQVPIRSADEFGAMGRIFNTIGPQLRDRYQMHRSLDVAMQIQQSLLPTSSPQLNGLDIYGTTLFSDETGGDYFDYLCVDEKNFDKLCVAVGDVAGHGISSALLMATVRGFLRLRAAIPGNLEEITADINRAYTKDVETSGEFMTLFLARIDRGRNRIEWVRAGHEPALLYDPQSDTFTSLKGAGDLPLGISSQAVFRQVSLKIKTGQIVFMATDGIAEARNAQNELFGRRRVRPIIRQYAHASAKTIALSILDAVEEFRGPSGQEDDLTLVVTKITDVRSGFKKDIRPAQ